MFKKAFTLAEIMIVLVIIGVITAILLPVAINSAPDENVMKFKKGNNTLGVAIRELVNSEQYYANGDLGKLPNGNPVSSSTYFCETLSDIMNTKEVNCDDNDTGIHGFFGEDWIKNKAASKTIGEPVSSLKEYVDIVCKKIETVTKSSITTLDNIVYYEVNPLCIFSQATFYLTWNRGGTDEELIFVSENPMSECDERNIYYGNTTTCPVSNGFLFVHKIFCMDVDGINKGEDPFGYGIRVDGKILTGARAEEWINKSVQKGE